MRISMQKMGLTVWLPIKDKRTRTHARRQPPTFVVTGNSIYPHPVQVEALHERNRSQNQQRRVYFFLETGQKDFIVGIGAAWSETRAGRCCSETGTWNKVKIKIRAKRLTWSLWSGEILEGLCPRPSAKELMLLFFFFIIYAMLRLNMGSSYMTAKCANTWATVT